MDDDLSDIILHQLINEARQGNENSLGRLMDSIQVKNLLDLVSTQVAHQFRVDSTLIREELFDKLCSKIKTLKKPKFKTLTSWAFTTARHFCLNQYRHGLVVNKHSEQVVHSETNGKRKSCGGDFKPLPSSLNNSPEDIMLEQERCAVLDDLALQVIEIINSFEANDRSIVIHWGAGKLLREISEATGVPLSTVQKHLKKLQKEIIRKSGLQRLLDRNSNQDQDEELPDFVYEVLAHMIQDSEPFHSSSSLTT